MRRGMGSACRTTPYVGEVQQHYDVPLGEGEALVGSVMTGWGGPEGPGVRSLAAAGWETAGLCMPSGFERIDVVRHDLSGVDCRDAAVDGWLLPAAVDAARHHSGTGPRC